MDRTSQSRNQAVACVQASIVSPSTVADEYLDRGLVRWMYGDIVGAIRFYRVAVRLDPKKALSHYLLGSALEQAGRAQEARHQFLLVLDAADETSQARWARSMVTRAASSVIEHGAGTSP